MALTPTRSETAANWASSNPILTNNEIGIESDTGVVKRGDGVRRWSKLNVVDNQATTPTFVTPSLGVATATSITSTGIHTSAGNDTSSGATVTAPAVSSGVAFTPSTTKNSQVTFQLAGITGSYTVTYGPSTGTENTLASAVPTLLGVGDVESFMVPKGWKVVLTLTTVTLTATLVTTF